jgi:hypothetical protein
MDQYLRAPTGRVKLQAMEDYMRRHLVLTTSLVAGLLSGCGKEDDTCGDGYARADDGNCYPINAEGDEDDGSIDVDDGTPDADVGTTDGAPDADADADADGGTADTDGSSADTDGSSADTGGSSADTDGGTPDMDGGTPDMDGGAPDMDGGTPDMDGGTPDMDGGTPDMDGGTPDMDGGPPDGGDLDDGGPIDDTGSTEITADCADGALTGTSAMGTVRDWTGGGSPITFTSAAWYWDSSSNTATVLISDAADSCGEIITEITDGTYTGAATSLVISDWTELGPDTLDVFPLGVGSPSDVRVAASAYYHDGTEGGSWPLDGFTGTVAEASYGSVAVLYIEDGARFEAAVQLYGADASEGVDGNFEACYCTDLSSLIVPGETIGEGGDGPPIEPDAGPLDEG